MANVVIGFWNNSEIFQRYKVENVDLDGKVQVLKSQFLETVANGNESLPKDLEFAFCGVILEDDNSLSSYGVTSGVTVHIVENKTKKNATESKKITEVEIQDIVSSFRNFKVSPSFRSTLHRLENPDEVDKIIANVPGLADDPIAISIISKPDLIMQMGDPKTVRKIAEKHPKLIEAAKYIGTELHKDSGNLTANTTQPSTSTGYSYSLEALSEDDDDDMDSNSDTNMPGHPLTRNSSYNAITAAQLAAAIANATNTAFNTNSAGMPGTPTSGVITNEMFSNAIQQAFGMGGSSSGSFSPSTPTTSGEETLENITRRLEPQLQQMHEMGLVNDSVNVRALQATNGDVQAAIELVFNGVID